MSWETGDRREFKFDPNSTENEGRWRLYDPKKVDGKSYFRRKSSTAGVSYVMGKAKGGPSKGGTVVQAVRFDKSKFTEDEAAEWWTKNHGRDKLVFSDEGGKKAMDRTESIADRVASGKRFDFMGRYKGYWMYHVQWTNTLGEERHNAAAMREKPRSSDDDALYGQAWREDEKYNDGKGYPLYSTEYNTKEDAVEAVRSSIDRRRSREAGRYRDDELREIYGQMFRSKDPGLSGLMTLVSKSIWDVESVNWPAVRRELEKYPSGRSVARGMEALPDFKDMATKGYWAVMKGKGIPQIGKQPQEWRDLIRTWETFERNVLQPMEAEMVEHYMGLGRDELRAASSRTAGHPVLDAVMEIVDGMDGWVSEQGEDGLERFWKKDVLDRYDDMARRGKVGAAEMGVLLKDLVDGLEGVQSEQGDTGRYWKAGVLGRARRALRTLKMAGDRRIDGMAVAKEILKVARELTGEEMPGSFRHERNERKMERDFRPWFDKSKGRWDAPELFDRVYEWVRKNMPADEKDVDEDGLSEKEHDMILYLVGKYGDEELKGQLP